jgi:acetylornithine/N-succinyldiaminopimelate aminotransferase
MNPTDTTQTVIEQHDNYLSPNYPRYPIAMVEGRGARLKDADGKHYLDFFAGFGAPVLGHCHPDLVKAVSDQASKLWHVGNLFHTQPQVDAARAIAELGFGGQSFFCHAGADANEAAIKLARLYGKAHRGKSSGGFGRFKLISCTRSFHGRSFATMGATGNAKVREGFGPFLPGYGNVAYNDIEAVREAIDDETVAVIAEPIQGEGGVHVPDPDYFAKLRSLCDEHDLLLICDEVWTGVGRTGKYFGHQHWFDEASGGPDIMTLGKGVGGGLAVGVMCARPELAELYNARTQGGVKHATTLGGNCLSMAVTAKIFDVIQRDGLVERAASLGDRMMNDLRSFASSHDVIREVRGRGLFIGVELDLASSDTELQSGSVVVDRCREHGLLINAASANVLRLAPPMTLSDAEADEGLGILKQVLAG